MHLRALSVSVFSGAFLAASLTAATVQASEATLTSASETPAYPLVTSGNQILDSNGEIVIWQGVNWFGLETANQAPHGLWARDYQDMVAQIAELGFNTIRLPFSIQAVQGTTTTGIDYGSGRNSELQGLTPLQVMDEVIAEAGRHDLMVILDNHSLANDGYMYDLWYDQGGYAEQDWIDNWRLIAARYRDTGNVVAFDLKNEPHGRATWGDGTATDWRLAAERAGNAILEIAPDKLIVVEGIEGPVAGGQVLDINWWGGNLEGVHDNPVRLTVPNRLVYSAHEYGPEVYAQPWFSDPNMAQILAERWEAGFGYIHTEQIAPILIGEFGAKAVDISTVEGKWITQFAEYLARTGISWTFWAWNPNSGDTGGVLTDDWTTVHQDKMALLSDLMASAQSSEPLPLPAPVVPQPEPDLSESVTVRLRRVAVWDGGSCYVLRVHNRGDDVLESWRVRVRVPKGTAVTSQWGVGIRTSGRGLIMSFPEFSVLSPGERSTGAGLCIDSSRKPRKLRVLA